jgi:hypothetical protein
VFWDIAGVKGSVSSGSVAVPEWNPEPVQKEDEMKNGETPWWVYALVLSVAVTGAASMYFGENEYLQTVQNAMGNSLGAIRTAANWFYGNMGLSAFVEDFLWPFMFKIIFEPSSAQGFTFTIISYLLTLNAPSLEGLIGTWIGMFAIYAGPTEWGMVATVVAAALTFKALWDYVMKWRK